MTIRSGRCRPTTASRSDITPTTLGLIRLFPIWAGSSPTNPITSYPASRRMSISRAIVTASCPTPRMSTRWANRGWPSKRRASDHQRLREPQQQRGAAPDPAKIVKVEEIERRQNQDGHQQCLQPYATGAERVWRLGAEPDIDGHDAAGINQRPFEDQQGERSG